MKRYQGENQGLKILYKVVKDAQALWILRFRNVDQRTNFCSLRAGTGQSVNFSKRVGTCRTSKEICSLPSRISNSCRPSLFFCGHLLSSSLFIVSQHSSDGIRAIGVLHDFAGLDNSFDLINQEGAHTHYRLYQVSPVRWRRMGEIDILSFRMRESFR